MNSLLIARCLRSYVLEETARIAAEFEYRIVDDACNYKIISYFRYPFLLDIEIARRWREWVATN